MKKRSCGLILAVLFVCVIFVTAHADFGRSDKYVVSGLNADLDGNVYGWYTGDPNGSVVIMVGLGNSQDAYAKNAIPVYTHDLWSDKNVYWFAAEVNGRSGSIHDGFSKEDLDILMEFHYEKCKDVFPNATYFVVGGYSAGGWAIASLADVVLSHKDILAGIFGLDCVPKNDVYSDFVQTFIDAHRNNIPTFIGASLKGATGNRIEKRTVTFANDYAAFVSVYKECSCKHGDLCKQATLRDSLAMFVDTAIAACVPTDVSVDTQASSNLIEGVQPVVLKDITQLSEDLYSFRFDLFDKYGAFIESRSVSLFGTQILAISGCDALDDVAFTKCAEYYMNKLAE